jgi:hypothetical protein
MMLWDWITSPEAQADPHYWLATAAGHVLIGAVAWGAVAWGLSAACGRQRRWLAAGVVLAVYAGVEAVELAYWPGAAAAGLEDGAVDWGFVAGGTGLAWGAWAHRLRAVSVAVVGLAGLALIFGPKGKPRDDV